MPEILTNDQNIIGPEGQGPITMNPEEKGPEGVEAPQEVQAVGPEGVQGTEQTVRETFAGVQEAEMPVPPEAAAPGVAETPGVETEEAKLAEIQQEIANLTASGQAEVATVEEPTMAAPSEEKTEVEQTVAGAAFAQELADKAQKQEGQSGMIEETKKVGFWKRLFGKN